jgi:hypothetical protein
MELNLLGITLAVLILLEVLIDTEIDPILLRDSDTEIKQPFSNERNFIRNVLLLADVIVRTVNVSYPSSGITI